jgi:REP-associated tyrosine transposase
MKQVAFKFRGWGGKRKGAGRKPKGARAGVGHRRRESLKARFPVHVTWRMREHVWGLRTRRCFGALARAFWGGANRFGFKLVHYSVQGNHVHLLVEARDERALARGMNGLGVRVARGLNRVMKREGRVLADRYHAHILRSPTEARRARVYLLQNARRHYGAVVADGFTSTTPVIEPDTFLMRRLC